ncbi:unnamed protein product [Cochlearia groenlandica]
METVSVETGGSISNHCTKNLELIGKKNKKKKKKKRSKTRKMENEMKNNVAVSSNEDKDQLSDKCSYKLPSESCQRDSISCKEPGATLHHKDPIFPSRKDSLPDADMNDESRKRSRSGKKKKKKDDASCEDNLLDSVEKTTNEDSKADATNMTCSKRRKSKKTRVRNAMKESGVGVHSINAETDATYNIISESEGSKSTSIEEKTGTSVVMNSCLKAKDDLVEQQKGTDLKLKETVAQTQISKAKKKKKKRTKTMEVCDPLGNTLATSTQSEPVECISGEENGFQRHGKSKEEKTNENIEVKEDVLGAGECDAKSKKKKRKKKKMSSADPKTADNIEVCDPPVNTLPVIVETGSVECLLDHSNQKDVENCYGNGGQEFVHEDTASKTENIARRKKSKGQNPEKRKAKTEDENVESNQDALGAESKRKSKTEDENVESNQDALGAEVDSDIGSKRHKKKRKKNKNESIGNLASEAEVSAAEGKSVNNVDDTKTKIKVKKSEADDDDDVGVDCDNKLEVKTKKKKKNKNKKSSLDHKTNNMEANDDVSLPENDAELESTREKLEVSLSSSVLIHTTPVQGVASPETRDVPRCSCDGQRTKKLVVFDLNGILADIVQGYTGEIVPDGKVSYRSVFLRPFVHSFLDFCFERFDIGIWSSRHIGLDYMTNLVMRNHARNVLFCFGQNICITTRFKTPENSRKPLFLKNLGRVWERFGTCFTCGKRKYDETNTLLIDDSPDKSLCNPPHTGIFPHTYQYTDHEDTALGPEGELRKYLERLAEATSVQKFVAENPYGQTAITETHESWEFYSKVVAAYSNPSTRF